MAKIWDEHMIPSEELFNPPFFLRNQMFVFEFSHNFDFPFQQLLFKGQLNSEWIYEVIVSPQIFCPERVGQKSGKILVGI